MDQLLYCIANESEVATEGVGESIGNFFKKIGSGIMWLLRKIKELVLKIINWIRNLFSKRSTGVRSVINDIVREFKTKVEKIIKDRHKPENGYDATNLQGMFDPETGQTSQGNQLINIREEDVEQGAKALEAALTCIADDFEENMSDIMKLMQETLDKDEDILSSQIKFTQDFENMRPSLMSTEKITGQTLPDFYKLKDDIVKRTNACKETVVKGLYDIGKKSTNADKNGTKFAATYKNLNPAIIDIIQKTIEANSKKLIDAVKADTPNFQQYFQKFEGHEKMYHSNADKLEKIISSMQNEAKTSGKINESIGYVFKAVDNVVKANLEINNIYMKLITYCNSGERIRYDSIKAVTA